MGASDSKLPSVPKVDRPQAGAFDPFGNILSPAQMLQIQAEIKSRSRHEEKEYSPIELAALKPKLIKLYDLIDAWRADTYMLYQVACKDMKAEVKAAAEEQKTRRVDWCPGVFIVCTSWFVCSG